MFIKPNFMIFQSSTWKNSQICQKNEENPYLTCHSQNHFWFMIQNIDYYRLWSLWNVWTLHYFDPKYWSLWNVWTLLTDLLERIAHCMQRLSAQMYSFTKNKGYLCVCIFTGKKFHAWISRKKISKRINASAMHFGQASQQRQIWVMPPRYEDRFEAPCINKSFSSSQ